MNVKLAHHVAADMVLVIHVLFVAFVVIGLVLIIVGLLRHWRWVRNLWFRTAHLLSIGIVVTQAWVDLICPLTIWENYLRHQAGDAVYAYPFIRHWLQELIFYDAEPWVFVLCYTIFGALVLVTWILGPPKWGRDEEVGS